MQIWKICLKFEGVYDVWKDGVVSQEHYLFVLKLIH